MKTLPSNPAEKSYILGLRAGKIAAHGSRESDVWRAASKQEDQSAYSDGYWDNFHTYGHHINDG